MSLFLMTALSALGSMMSHASCANNPHDSSLACEVSSKIVLVIEGKNACREPSMNKMKLQLIIGDERFDFSPACGNSIWEKVTTRTRLECEIKSGMCSELEPKKKIVVACGDKSAAEFAVRCN